MSTTASQRKAFQQYEANQWFIRNKPILDNYAGENDFVINLLQLYNIKPLRILEIGCSAGYRLNYLRNLFPAAEITGIDPSSEAVNAGKRHYPGVELFEGTADDLSRFEDGYFDLIIVGFVFYVIDRSLLLRVVAEIDRVLCNKAVVINIDFFSERPNRNRYHHITEFDAFSFKQNYENIFIASEMYQLLHRVSFHHEKRLADATDDYFNKCSATLLKKDIDAVYR